MTRFRRMKTLQKFASVQADFHNHFNLECPSSIARINMAIIPPVAFSPIGGAALELVSPG